MSRVARTRIVFLLLVATGCSGGGAGQADAPASTSAQGSDAADAREPLVLTSTPETEHAGQGTVSFDAGGTINATASDGTAFALVVPPEAETADTEITMTPLTDMAGIEADAMHGVLLEPDGTEFYELLRLTITPAQPIPFGRQLMFEAAGDGADPQLALIDPDAEAIVILLDHFSVAGIATADEAQRARMLEKSAANAEARLIGQVRQRIGEERARYLLGEGDDEAAGGAPREVLDAIAAEYQREVLDKRRAVAEESCSALKEYVRSVIRWERQLQIAGVTAAEESASQDRVAEALQYAQSRKKECEDEAIAACKEAEDPQILIDFWLWIGDSVNKKRAEQICEPQGLQFEMHGSGSSDAQGDVTWDFWAVKCEGRDDWMIWENLVTSEAGSTRTGPPEAADYGPVRAIFGPDGVIAEASWPGAGAGDPLSQSPPGWGSLTGADFTLTPPDKPTEVQAQIPVGFSDSAPVEPYDGTIADCAGGQQP